MLFQSWNDFWFQRIDVRLYALLRIGLGFLILLYLADYLRDFQDQFGPHSWLGAIQDLKLYHAGPWSLWFLTGSEQLARLMAFCILLAAGFFTLGYKTRWCGLITLIGLISFWNRNPLVLDGDDAILRIMLFYLLLAPCGNAFSIDHRLQPQVQHTEIWPLRMMQIQLALVYFISGWVKFHSPEWLDGSVLQFVLIHPEYARWDLSILVRREDLQPLLHALTTVIMYWELCFPILVSLRATRPITILIGLIFHSGLLLFLHLRLFSVIMLFLYTVWIPNRFFAGRVRSRLQDDQPSP